MTGVWLIGREGPDGQVEIFQDLTIQELASSVEVSTGKKVLAALAFETQADAEQFIADNDLAAEGAMAFEVAADSTTPVMTVPAPKSH